MKRPSSGEKCNKIKWCTYYYELGFMNQAIAALERQTSKLQRDDPSVDQQSINRIYLL